MLLGLLTPKICELCGCELIKGEQTVCSVCLADIRPTDMHRIPDNPLRERLPRTAPIATVGAFAFYTHDAPIATLLRRAKYNNRPDIVDRLARIYARRLLADGVLNGVELLQAVPMHWFKRLRRGYNQAQVIAKAFSEECNIPMTNSLQAVRGHKSQTLQSASGRLSNVSNTFSIKNTNDIEGRHIAVVDDILTTGATLSEAINQLAKHYPSRISVFTLAATPIC